MSAFERDHVISFLDDYLQPLGLDLENTHINEVDNLIEAQVVASRPLVDEVIHWLEMGDEPTYDLGLVGAFSEPGSFADEHRVTSLRLTQLERAIRTLLDSAR